MYSSPAALFYLRHLRSCAADANGSRGTGSGGIYAATLADTSSFDFFIETFCFVCWIVLSVAKPSLVALIYVTMMGPTPHVDPPWGGSDLAPHQQGGK